MLTPDRIQPLKVLNPDAGKVRNLDADELDGLDSSELKARATPTYMVSVRLDGVANEARSSIIECDSGDEVLAGGYHALSAGAQIRLSIPQPGSPLGGSWFIELASGSVAGSVTMDVLCYDYPPAHVAEPSPQP